MLNLDLECRMVTQRMEELRSRAEHRRLLREARAPRAPRRVAVVVRIRPVSDTRKARA
jgi:hypothetical protein